MRNSLERSVDEAILASQFLKRDESLSFIEEVVTSLVGCFQEGGKLLIAGNGGSLCDAAHFAEELTGIFRRPRKALPALALSDAGHMSCVANDLGYDEVFSRAVEAYGKKEDRLILLTTSGNSENLVRAAIKAEEREIKTVGFLGKDGGRLRGMCDLEWIVSGFSYSDRIQEAHMAAIHIIIEQVEKALFPIEKTTLSHVS